jgi:methylmalonyl-CoA mutase
MTKGSLVRRHDVDFRAQWEYDDVTSLELAAGFPTATHEEWQKLVRGVLVKGRRLAEDASLEAAEAGLDTTLIDGITVHGLYTAASVPPSSAVPGRAPFTRGRLAARSGWDVRPLHEDPDPVATHQAVLDDLEGGASSVWLRLGGDGLPVDALPTLLDGVYLDLAPVVLDAGAATMAAAEGFFAVAAAHGVADEVLLGVLGADPIGLAARTGGAPDLSVATSLASTCAERFPGVRAVVVDALPYAEAGATDAQELGMALAAGVAYLRPPRNWNFVMPQRQISSPPSPSCAPPDVSGHG